MKCTLIFTALTLVVPSLAHPYNVQHAKLESQGGVQARAGADLGLDTGSLVARNADAMDEASKAELLAHLQGRDAEPVALPMDEASKAELLAHLQGRDADPISSPMDEASKAELLAHIQGRSHPASTTSSFVQRDLLNSHLIKRELAVRQVNHTMTHHRHARLMVRELGGLLSHFSKRDGSAIDARDIQLVSRDLNTLMIREARKKLHVASPHEIKMAFKKAGHWLKTKAGPWLKQHAVDIVSTVVSAVPGMQPAGMAMKVANAIKTGVQAGVKAGKAAKNGKDAVDKGKEVKQKHDDKKDKKKKGGKGKRDAEPDQSAAAAVKDAFAQLGIRDAEPNNEAAAAVKDAFAQLGIRDAEPNNEAAAAVKDAFAQLGIRSAEPEDAAAAVAKAFAEIGIRDVVGPVASILDRRDIVIRDPTLLLERLVGSAMTVTDHVMKREAEAEPLIDTSTEMIDSLIQRSLDSIASASSVILRRNADDDVVGLSELHVRALAPHLVEAME